MALAPKTPIDSRRSANGWGSDSTSARHATARAADTVIRHILVPVRLDESERESVSLALRMAAAHRARVTFLHVVSAFETPSAHWLDAIDNLHRALAGYPRDVAPEIRKHEAKVRAFLEREIRGAAHDDIEVGVECRVGDVASEISRATEELGVDLVVLRRRSTGRRPARRPGLSARVVQLSAIPIMIA